VIFVDTDDTADKQKCLLMDDIFGSGSSTVHIGGSDC